MAKQQNSGKITIANMVSVVGVVLLLVFTFMGYSYMSGGELGWDILVSGGITGFTVLLLWFLIKSKGAENNLDKWKIAEIATLAVYVIFAVSTSLFGGIMHFFVVNDHKDDIKQYATMDLNKIDKLFQEYKTYESEAIRRTGLGLSDATGTGQVCDSRLNDFMTRKGIAHNRESARNYEAIQRRKLVEDGYDELYKQFEQQKNEIQNVVNSWSIMLIPSKANLIGKLADNAEKELTKLSVNAELPEISFDSRERKHTIGDNQQREFKIQGGSESFQFCNAIREADGFSVTALLIVLLIHTLILFNYVVSYRTHTINPDILEEDGGRIL